MIHLSSVDCGEKVSFSLYFAVQYVQRYCKNKSQICLLDGNGYVYSCCRKFGGSKYWRCIQRTLSKCEAKCTTFYDRMKTTKGFHNHGPTYCESTMTLVGNPSDFLENE